MHPPRKKMSINSKYMYPYVTTKLENYYNWLTFSFARFRLQVFSLCTSRPLQFLRCSVLTTCTYESVISPWQEVSVYTNTILAPHLPYTPDLFSSDFHFFLKIKHKGCHLNTLEEMQYILQVHICKWA